jgi:hypothetical protein
MRSRGITCEQFRLHDTRKQKVQLGQGERVRTIEVKYTDRDSAVGWRGTSTSSWSLALKCREEQAHPMAERGGTGIQIAALS